MQFLLGIEQKEEMEKQMRSSREKGLILTPMSTEGGYL